MFVLPRSLVHCMCSLFPAGVGVQPHVLAWSKACACPVLQNKCLDGLSRGASQIKGKPRVGRVKDMEHEQVHIRCRVLGWSDFIETNLMADMVVL